MTLGAGSSKRNIGDKQMGEYCSPFILLRGTTWTRAGDSKKAGQALSGSRPFSTNATEPSKLTTLGHWYLCPRSPHIQAHVDWGSLCFGDGQAWPEATAPSHSVEGSPAQSLPNRTHLARSSQLCWSLTPHSQTQG